MVIVFVLQPVTYIPAAKAGPACLLQRTSPRAYNTDTPKAAHLTFYHP